MAYSKELPKLSAAKQGELESERQKREKANAEIREKQFAQRSLYTTPWVSTPHNNNISIAILFARN